MIKTLFIVLHILCLLIFAGGRFAKIFHFGPSLFAIAVLVPVYGPLCLLSVEVNQRRKIGEERVIDVNQMKIEDEIYRSIHVRPDDSSKGVVPLEESLLINPAVKRRQLLLNVLSLHVADYVPSLRLAGLNDDTEVVHYAVTALVELRKDFDSRFEKAEREMRASQGDPQALREYIDLEESYIGSGLPEKGDLKESISKYDSLLVEAAKDSRTARDKAVLLQKRVENALALRDYDRALPLIDQLIKMEPEKEEGYLLRIRCLSALKNRKEIDTVLQAIRDNHVFLSEEGRKTLAFWQPDGVRS